MGFRIKTKQRRKTCLLESPREFSGLEVRYYRVEMKSCENSPHRAFPLAGIGMHIQFVFNGGNSYRLSKNLAEATSDVFGDILVFIWLSIVIPGFQASSQFLNAMLLFAD